MYIVKQIVYLEQFVRENRSVFFEMCSNKTIFTERLLLTLIKVCQAQKHFIYFTGIYFHVNNNIYCTILIQIECEANYA